MMKVEWRSRDTAWTCEVGLASPDRASVLLLLWQARDARLCVGDIMSCQSVLHQAEARHELSIDSSARVYGYSLFTASPP